MLASVVRLRGTASRCGLGPAPLIGVAGLFKQKVGRSPTDAFSGLPRGLRKRHTWRRIRVESIRLASEGNNYEPRQHPGNAPRYRNDNKGDATVDPDAENLKTLVLRVAAASTEEIDRVILELQGVRDTLRSEGERLNRELARFTNINHAAMTATKVIGDHLKQSGAVKRQ